MKSHHKVDLIVSDEIEPSNTGASICLMKSGCLSTSLDLALMKRSQASTLIYSLAMKREALIGLIHSRLVKCNPERRFVSALSVKTKGTIPTNRSSAALI